MPTSSTAATVDKRKSLKLLNLKGTEQHDKHKSEKNLLKIAPALPVNERRNLYVRSHSTLNATSISKAHDAALNDISIQTNGDGSVHVSRTQEEKEKIPDRISLDRRGLTTLPVIFGEPKLRLLSLQHNLLSNLETLKKQRFPVLVFLDLYDNQLDNIQHLEALENLRVLLMGKNRIKKIEGLETLKRLEVLDLHGNQISQVCGLCALTELKVLNLAGNQIKLIGAKDLQGLDSLQELNLRRNRLRKLLGFGDTPNLYKLFISNNDLQSVEDISSIAKSQNIKEISIDNNPVFLGGDCISFLVSYLPNLTKLNMMQITEQVRKSAMAWRRNKEATNAAFMDLTSEASLNFRREEVISNARTNWELLRSQTKCLRNNAKSVEKSVNNLKPDSDFVLTSLAKPNYKADKVKKKTCNAKFMSKVPLLPDKLSLVRSPSQDTENSQNTSSSNNSGADLFKLPPILVPIISKLEQKIEEKESAIKSSGSLSSIGPNVDSSVSSLASGSEAAQSTTTTTTDSESGSGSSSESEADVEAECNKEGAGDVINDQREQPSSDPSAILTDTSDISQPNKSSGISVETASNLSTGTNSTSASTLPSTSNSSGSAENSSGKSTRARSAMANRRTTAVPPRCAARAATAKAKRQQASPVAPKDREQGGDYLIEICGRHLNVYGQGALRFVDKPWSAPKANDVTTVKFSYVNFNSVAGFLGKVKNRFPNVEHLVFKETNIYCVGQLNALAEVQGFVSLTIDSEGNPICEKQWESYAIYRLAHWGLKMINEKEITEADVKSANAEYQSLSELVLWSLPDVLLQPLLVRLRIDVSQGVVERDAKKWLMTADEELRNVVCKEALQWKKASASQEDTAMRQKAKLHISSLLEEMVNAMEKLRALDHEWPTLMHEFIQNTLLDYSQLDMYMKQKIQELNK